MSKTNIEKEVRRAKEIAKRFEALKASVAADDAALADLRAEHGDEGDPTTVPAHIARLFEDAPTRNAVQPLASSPRTRGPFVRG